MGGVLVPTMGALHAGHAALIRAAANAASLRGVPTVVTVFVNPTQFNERDDYDHYPRSLDDDLDICERAGASVVLAPAVSVVYPRGSDVPVPSLPPIATEPGLEDLYRPGHFPGVAQVLTRLYALLGPVAAVYGEKDWQQLALAQTLAREAGGPEVIGAPTAREPDGLAMSSRNRRLSEVDRRRAVGIARALRESRSHASPERAEVAMRAVLHAAGLGTEYAVVRDAATLMSPRPGHPSRALIAARCGPVRLIDNAAWPGGGPGTPDGL